MSSLLFEATGFLDKYLISGALSSASGDALRPLLQSIVNEAWKGNAVIPPPFVLLAEGVAQGQVDPAKAREWALEQGYDKEQFNALVNIANTGPPIGQALELLRRIDPATGASVWSPDDFATALNRQGIEKRWWAGIAQLKERLLDPADLARAIHKSIIPDPGLLAVPQPEGEGKVKAYPVYPIKALDVAAGFGYTKDDLGVLVGLQGNPMGAHEAAQATFRKVIEPVDYERAIAEGNTRNEWGPAIFEQSRQISTAHEAVENTIRGYSDQATMLQRTARHGMTPEDSMILFQNAGRPLVAHQITTGIARGGEFRPEPGEQTDPYDAAVRESNVKPSYYDLWKANRYSYPSLFQLNALVKGSAIDPGTARDWANKDGYAPEVVAALYKFWQAEAGSGKGKAADPHLKSAVTTTVTAIRKAFVAKQITAAQADTYISDAEDAAGLTAVWDILRTITQLPPAAPTTDPTTLVAEAEALGYTVKPPPPPLPKAVIELLGLGYTVTKPV